MKRVILILLVILICINVVDASLKIIEGRCEEEGVLKLTVALNESISGKINLDDVVITASYFDYVTYESEKVLLRGTWDIPFIGGSNEYGKFISDEAMLNNRRTYDIKVAYGGEADSEEMVCPGLVFSCSLLGTGIKDCYTNNNRTFVAEIILQGLNQSESGELDYLRDMEYKIRAYDRYDSVDGTYSIRGSLPEGYEFESLEEDVYKISYYFRKDNYVKDFSIAFRDLSECRTKKYSYLKLYDHKECREIFDVVEEVKEEKSLEMITGSVVEEIDEVEEECELPNVEIDNECCEDKDRDGMCDKYQQVVELGKSYIWAIWLLLVILIIAIGVIVYLIKQRKKKVQYY